MTRYRFLFVFSLCYLFVFSSFLFKYPKLSILGLNILSRDSQGIECLTYISFNSCKVFSIAFPLFLALTVAEYTVTQEIKSFRIGKIKLFEHTSSAVQKIKHC